MLRSHTRTHQVNPPEAMKRGPAGPRLFLLVAAASLAVALSWSVMSRPRTARAHDAIPGPIVQIYSVGGVLTADGKLWQYNPEKRQWLTIDDAFKAQGKDTRILPLPVRAEEIHDMVTWGFILTRSGACWLYDLEKNRWEQLPAPPRD